jgi:DNA-binding transcriptional MerR regulator
MMPPMTTYSMAELKELTGFAARSIRHHASLGLLPKTEYHGNQTRYDHEYLLRLLAIRKLTAKGMTLNRVKATLRKMSPEELEEFAAPDDEPGPEAPSVPAATPSTPAHAGASPEAPRVVGEKWTRVPILPGLDLQLRDDAAEVVRRIAGEIQRRYQAT